MSKYYIPRYHANRNLLKTETKNLLIMVRRNLLIMDTETSLQRGRIGTRNLPTEPPYKGNLKPPDRRNPIPRYHHLGNFVTNDAFKPTIAILVKVICFQKYFDNDS